MIGNPYNDRAQVEVHPMAQVESQAEEQRPDDNPSKIPQPEISIIVDGNKVFKPGMKSVFIDDDENAVIGSDNGTHTGGGYCSCNSVSVCTCNTVCTCESVCSCVGHCSCNQVCSCESHCSCNQVCTCNSQCSCQSNYGGSYCSCVPVH